MGVKNLPLIAERLIGAGRPPEEPVAVVQRATLPGQRSVDGTLADIAERMARAEHPAARDHRGRTRGGAARDPRLDRAPARCTASGSPSRARGPRPAGWPRRLRSLGAEVAETPAIRIEPRPVEGELARAVDEIGEYALVCLTSPNGAALLMDALAVARPRRPRAARSHGRRHRARAPPPSWRAPGIRADVVPERSVAEALVEALADVPVEGRRVLVARAAEARDVLPDALGARGARVDVVALYDTVAEPLGEAEREALAAADYVTFTSSSTVRFLLDALGSRRRACPRAAGWSRSGR